MVLLRPNPRLFRTIVPAIFIFAIFTIVLQLFSGTSEGGSFLKSIPIILDIEASSRRPPTNHAPPKHKPAPAFTPPPITDPFPLLATSIGHPPSIPPYNVARPNMHKEYGLDRAPPLFIGFTRQWPMLLQAVVSYITAGWPADGIYVVENTGVHNSNRDGKLSLQNPFYLNHTTLQRLGVNIVQTPTLLSFSQMQNFFLSLSYQYEAPHYFYSHQDVVVFSFEEGLDKTERPGDRKWQYYDVMDRQNMTNLTAAPEPGYRTIYENCLRELQMANERDRRWGFRWFQYDHLTLVNRAALEAVNGWDSLIPYYASDCDMNGKLALDGWSVMHRHVGIINDVSSSMKDLAALYRDPTVTPTFADPNPLPPDEEKAIKKAALEEAAKKKLEEELAKNQTAAADAAGSGKGKSGAKKPLASRATQAKAQMPADPLLYFPFVNQVGLEMGLHKYRDHDRVRNTWQTSQRGGQGEPYYYDPVGFGIAFDLLTEAGRAVFREKWGHRGCDFVDETALKLQDQWKVMKDWEDEVPAKPAPAKGKKKKGGA